MTADSGTPFRYSNISGVFVWSGFPDCQAAHDALLVQLEMLKIGFLTSDPTASQFMTLKGNMGEFIAWCIGKWNDTKEYLEFPANAKEPLLGVSRPHVDIVWLHLGDDPDDDYAIFQEVKCTSGKSLTTADDLVSDYAKLFSTDANRTLRARLDQIKNDMDSFKSSKPNYAMRINALFGTSPSTANGIILLPTLVYDLNQSSNASDKMAVVRSRLIGKGWKQKAIKLWAIGLSDIDDRVLRLAKGQK